MYGKKMPTWQVAHITGGCSLLIYTGVQWVCHVTLEFNKAGIFVYLSNTVWVFTKTHMYLLHDIKGFI